MFVSIGVLAENRVDDKTPVTKVNNQSFLRLDWLLTTEIASLQDHVQDRHFSFVWQHSKNNDGLTRFLSLDEFFRHILDMDRYIPTRL